MLRPARTAALVLVLAAVLAACGGGDDGGGSVPAAAGDHETFCALAEEDELTALEDAELDDPAALAQARAALQELRDAAPPAVQDDADVVVEVLEQFLRVFSEVDLSDPDAVQAIQDDVASLEARQDEFEEAADNLDRYFEEECGIDTGAGDGG